MHMKSSETCCQSVTGQCLSYGTSRPFGRPVTALPHPGRLGGRKMALLYLHLRCLLLLLWAFVFHQLVMWSHWLVPVMYYSCTLVHSISAMILSVQSEAIQLCQELSVSACPVCISFIFIEKISCRVDLLILLMPTGMKPFDMRLM